MLFFEKGLSLTKGQVSFIAPNKWFATDYGEGLRRSVAERKALARVVDFKDFQLFDDATNYTCILSLSSKSREVFAYVDAHSGDISCEETLASSIVGSDTWSFSRGVEGELLSRLLNSGSKTLSDFRDRAFQGLRTSDNSVYVLRAAGPVRKGLMPVLSRATGKVHEIEASVLKPFLSGEEIRAFSLNHTDLWLLFPYDLSRSRPLLLDDRVLRERYEAAWHYFKQCEQRLRAREHGKMDGPEWWAYGRNQNLDQFKKPKIMLPDYHDRPAAALDLDGTFYSITAYCLTLKNDSPITLPVLACLLNSDLFFWVLSKIGTALQRGFVRFMPQYLDRLPVVELVSRQKEDFEQLIGRAESQGFGSIKSELNDLVSRVYGLKKDESDVIRPRHGNG